MTVGKLMEITGAEALYEGADMNSEVACGYACDLLSWVMAHGAKDMAWITVQTHMNVIAVASLMEMSCVILAEGVKAPDDVLAKAREEGVAVLGSGKTAYELSGLIYAAGVKAS